MTDFSDDEIFAFIACAVVALFGAYRWFTPIARITLIGGSARQRLVLGVLPWLCLALLFPVLAHAASHEVKEDSGYISLGGFGGTIPTPSSGG